MLFSYSFFSGLLGVSQGYRYAGTYSRFNSLGLFVYRNRVILDWFAFFFRFISVYSVWKLVFQGAGKILSIAPYSRSALSKITNMDFAYWTKKESFGWATSSPERVAGVSRNYSAKSFYFYDLLNVFSSSFWQFNNYGVAERFTGLVAGVSAPETSLGFRNASFVDFLLPVGGPAVDFWGYFYCRFLCQVFNDFSARRYAHYLSTGWFRLIRRLYKGHRFFFSGRALFQNRVFSEVRENLGFRSRWGFRKARRLTAGVSKYFAYRRRLFFGTLRRRGLFRRSESASKLILQRGERLFDAVFSRRMFYQHVRRGLTRSVPFRAAVGNQQASAVYLQRWLGRNTLVPSIFGHELTWFATGRVYGCVPGVTLLDVGVSRRRKPRPFRVRRRRQYLQQPSDFQEVDPDTLWAQQGN